ncbi:MAG: type II toxin-antitoxin system prevent-host-death family antitoxin [Chloroflexi bacterium]|nr:type II toxin-antitoxin system prevent-host-death family antitoxin [Chloroflexota bacterium]
MNLITVRDLRIRPGEVWQRLRKEQDLVLTSSGRPIALLIDLEGENVEEVLLAMRCARAQMAVSRIRQRAAQQGVDKLSANEIQTEIDTARGERD